LVGDNPTLRGKFLYPCALCVVVYADVVLVKKNIGPISVCGQL